MQGNKIEVSLKGMREEVMVKGKQGDGRTCIGKRGEE